MMTNSVNSEQCLIGCILLDGEAMYKVYNKIKPDMFLFSLLGECYSEMLAMYDSGEKIDFVTLANRLENHERSKEYVAEQLSNCVSAVQSSVFIDNYAATLLKEYRSRQVKDVFSRIDLSPNEVDKSIGEVIARFEELQENISVRSKSLKQIVEENKDKYFNDQKEENGVKTGFYKLDDCLGCLENGDVTVIGARPGVGKSALVTQIIGQMASKGKRIGYFNLEMKEEQVYERFVSRLSKISLTRVRRAKAFLGNEEDAFNTANEILMKYDVVISTGGKTISQIKAESRFQKFDVIVIDYLQLIRADRRFANRASEVGEISKSAKQLAMELNVPVILLSQLNRVSESKETKEPTMAELRESGDIEQDASNIILLWNLSEKNHSFKGLAVAKQRQGELMKEGLFFRGERMEFEERNETFEQFKKRAKASDNDFDDDDDSPFL